MKQNDFSFNLWVLFIFLQMTTAIRMQYLLSCFDLILNKQNH